MMHLLKAEGLELLVGLQGSVPLSTYWGVVYTLLFKSLLTVREKHSLKQISSAHTRVPMHKHSLVHMCAHAHRVISSSHHLSFSKIIHISLSFMQNVF